MWKSSHPGKKRLPIPIPRPIQFSTRPAALREKSHWTNPRRPAEAMVSLQLRQSSWNPASDIANKMYGSVRCPPGARVMPSSDLTDRQTRNSSRATMPSSFHFSIFGSVSILRSKIDRGARSPLRRVLQPFAVAAIPSSDSISRTQVLLPGPTVSHVRKNLLRIYVTLDHQSDVDKS